MTDLIFSTYTCLVVFFNTLSDGQCISAQIYILPVGTLVHRHMSDRDFPCIPLHEYTTYVYTMLPAKYIQNAIFFLLAPLARPRRITFCIPSVGEKARKLKAKEAARPL